MRRDLYRDIEEKENSHWWHLTKKELAKNLTKKYCKKFNSSNKVLDIGCGTGFILQALYTNAKLYGIDSEKPALEICKQKGLKTVKKGNAEKLSFQKEQFDLVTMFDVLEHTEEQKTISEVHRVLKKNGLVFITVPAYQWMWSKWDEVLKHHKRYTKNDLGCLLEKNNFKIVKISYLYTLIFPLAVVIRKIKNLLSNREYSTDFAMPSSLINQILLSIGKAEVKFLLNSSLPFGLSVVAVAKKK